ncbi:MAG: endonuclease [Bacteroidia bacterium]|nr:endonuclease [Bacteroidia bacterium]
MKFTFCLYFLLFISIGYSQIVIPEKHKLDFEQLEIGDSSSTHLKLFNPWPIALEISLFIPNTPGHNFFKLEPRFQKLFLINPKDTIDIELTFLATQNVNSSSKLYIRSPKPLGNVEISLSGSGILGNAYYEGTEHLWDKELILQLRKIMADGQKTFSYNQGRDLIFMEVDNLKNYPQGADSNSLLCMYTSRKIEGFHNRKEAQAMKFNTEHVWPQSLFDKKLPMKSDLHHIFPTDAEANNRRSNYPFGEIGQIKWEKMGSRLGNDQVFLPKEEARGKIARAMFYIAVRYENFKDYLKGQEEILLQWHREYPPDEMEKLRNEKVFEIQGNRNPFIDYPQLAERISTFRLGIEDEQKFEKTPEIPMIPEGKENCQMERPENIRSVKADGDVGILKFRRKPTEIRLYSRNGELKKMWWKKKRKIRYQKPKNGEFYHLILFKHEGNWHAWQVD